ncbi:MAG: hydroxymethylglutaryl-CoA lyase [Paracoccus sp. (in: a-proteobacteria)]|uniref:hydroxymethylglutaryl-CoA lyase n=1 Tax=unclassified Paracoccus (in: a-proteobacteria) TaxID=2688777 RepID=UPI000C4B42A3|nr:MULTISPECIES: hydroxymethylglutaryl-CoA lyase [unclassified Paracoccus (in: a-proteobacteria)]MAN56388.1 hydroxymethylglutaryl-CoA lyase [Paracoccus sp. (in: a-proteobacteria)]HIC65673.1 hydroxymethylglutaryl-CoA lyase [Paracoccus sp. (in: a-proteobacteria)]|tara:strand:- start:1991 stop:2854 length:864 start_codon:yes stop_codon:yes gene_type:complete
MPDHAEIFEMGPRDGLQNEKRLIPAARKIALVDLLSLAGFRRIEVTSFVSPKWVPQLGDAAQVMAGIARRPGVRYAALTPNMKGYEAAREAGASEVAIFASASEGFSRANLNAGIAESLDRFAPVARAARDDGIPVRGYVSVVTDCPFDGPTPPGNAARVAAALREMGCYEISLGDTIGQGRPETIDAMLSAVLDEVPANRLAGHYHDTAGRALMNIDASLARGLRVFDAAVGGLGGCPYAPGAKGNVATEKVARHLEALGHATGLDMAVIDRAAAMARDMRKEADV